MRPNRGPGGPELDDGTRTMSMGIWLTHIPGLRERGASRAEAGGTRKAGDLGIGIGGEVRIRTRNVTTKLEFHWAAPLDTKPVGQARECWQLIGRPTADGPSRTSCYMG